MHLRQRGAGRRGSWILASILGSTSLTRTRISLWEMVRLGTDEMHVQSNRGFFYLARDSEALVSISKVSR